MQFLVHVLAALLMASVPVMCSPLLPSVDAVRETRAAQDDCADPTTAQEFLVGFNPSQVYHAYTTRWDFINDATGGTDWSFQGPAFRAWTTLPPSIPTANVVAIWEFANTADSADRILVAGDAAGNAPSVDGYFKEGIRGYAYKTQVCGSVPLVGVNKASKTDHYYTTSTVEHDSLIASGWTDENVVIAYVLPA